MFNVAEAGSTVQPVRFGLHPDRHRKLEDEALAAAMERVREKAEQLATVEGLAVESVQSVTATEQPSSMEAIVDEALGYHSDTSFSPTPVFASKAVEVVYELTGVSV